MVSRNKLRKQTQETLINSILKIYQQYSVTPTPELYKERLNLKARYELLSTEKIKKFYENEKAGHLLAHQLKRNSVSKLIPSIRNTQQELTVKSQEISDPFRDFLKLCSSDFCLSHFVWTDFCLFIVYSHSDSLPVVFVPLLSYII